MGKLDFSGVAVFLHLDHSDKIQSQQGKIVEIVLRNGLAAQVSVDEPKATEAAGPPAESSDIGEVDMGGISEYHVADDPVAGEQNADLPAEVPGECGEMLCQFR